MLNKLKDSYKKLIRSNKFEDKGFLCGAFIMCAPEELRKNDWQIDFYDSKNDEMITYTINSNVKIEKSKSFTDGGEIKELNIDNVKVELDDALKKCSGMLLKHNDKATKIIVILQEIERLMWNITYVTSNFNILNVKIDAENGNILEENFSSMLQFKKD